MEETKYTIEQMNDLFFKIRSELSKAVKGQHAIIDELIIALFSGGHVLIEGVPGLGKTLLANTLSQIVGGAFKRIQFTPDLMPSDIIGTTIYNAEINKFQVKKGPVFTNILLADEVNRSPAKTQSALLQAMQEKEVNIDGVNYPLGDFFICLATQNPIEMEGTYPLPEAQIDRFMMKLFIHYPSEEEEINILKEYRNGFNAEKPASAGLEKVLDEAMIGAIKQSIDNVVIDDSILGYITKIITSTRSFPGIEVGSSPRGGISLFKAAKVKAVIAGRDFVVPDDVKDLALPILRHRVILEAEAEIEGYTSDDYLKQILEKVEVPR